MRATIFVRGLDGPPLGADQEAQLKSAFLYGCRASLGDPNVLHKPHRIELMMKRARKVGLESLTNILLAEMQKVRAEITAYDEVQIARYAITAPTDPTRAMLGMTDEDDGEDNDEIVYDG